MLEFIQDIRIPSSLHTDDAKELTSGHWDQVRKDHGIKQSPFQNCAEIGIRELKKHVRRIMEKTKNLKKLWDFCSQYVAEIHCLKAQP